MAQLLNLHYGTFFLNNPRSCNCNYPSNALMLLQHELYMYCGKFADIKKHRGVRASLTGSLEAVDHVDICSFEYKDYGHGGGESEAFPCIQTLRKFPKKDLFARTVLVRFDSNILLQEGLNPKAQSALFTIKHLYEAGAKVFLVSDWSSKADSEVVATESVADFLSSVLQLKVVSAQCISGLQLSEMNDFDEADILLLENLSDFKEEIANCTKFAEQLSSGVDIFVNDSFSLSHKILASTVGVARFCYISLAGFHFEESLHQLKKAAKTDSKPYVAIIGGGNFYGKAAALRFLASRCDGLVFVGMMAFQIMHALGLAVPFKFVEHGALKQAFDLIEFAQCRNIPILFPRDFLCLNNRLPNQLDIFPAHGISDGWMPVDIGPNSLDEISSLLAKCKKIIWIGPVKFKLPNYNVRGTSKLVVMLDKLGQSTCDITVVGTEACKAIMSNSCSPSVYNMIENARVLWEVLKGRKLPGLLALDRAYPHEIGWHAAYSDPAQPLVVDIGSGNGLFLFGMARRRKDLNFLGLEINQKLVRRCVDSVQKSGIKNGYFIATNATSTFRSIVSSYPGILVVVSVQCPNPDFNKPEYRWRMLQRSLVEAVVDLLKSNGKVFLQSDIEDVAARMKEQFLKYGKGKLTLEHEQDDEITSKGWLKENPFGVRSDWEQHVIDRGDPMYRVMLSKSSGSKCSRVADSWKLVIVHAIGTSSILRI